MQKIRFPFPLFFLLITLLFGCTKNSNVLTSAGQLEGTWKTPNNVLFYYGTNKCGGMINYAEQNQKVTWIITSNSDNEVSIFCSTDYKGPITVYSICNKQPVPVSYVMATVMKGIISSSQLDLYVNTIKVGSMSFTSNNLAGTYDRVICDTDGCTGLNCGSKTLILTKQ